MDIHVTVCGYLGVVEAQRLRAVIEREVPGSIVTVVHGSRATVPQSGPTEWKRERDTAVTATAVPEFE